MASTIQISEEEGEVRLDRFLMRRFPSLSFGEAQKLLRTGQVRVDGKRAKANQRLLAGQEIRLPPFLQEEQKTGAAAAPKNLIDQFAKSILFEDDSMIAINKPPGLAVQGGSKTRQHVDGIAAAWAAANKKPRPKLVHRIDKDTSGLLLLAKTPRAAASLARAFAQKKAQKIYWAVVEGVPKYEEGTIDIPLAKKQSKDLEKVEADEEGGRAITHYRKLDAAGFDFTLLELSPVTGRTHQLRVHCTAIGTPILGDGKYGAKAPVPKGLEAPLKLHLHARRITLPHPVRGEITLEAPLPPHFAATVKYFNFDTDA